MGQNFISCDRGQSFLLPPSLTDWLAEDHLVWTVLGAVEQMDLDGFYGAYRANGQGRAADDPAMMVALLLYSYAVGIRSSRRIERACCGDVAFKVITAMMVPDHSTIADFRRRHETAISELFVSVLCLCGEAGLGGGGGVAGGAEGRRGEAGRGARRRNRSGRGGDRQGRGESRSGAVRDPPGGSSGVVASGQARCRGPAPGEPVAGSPPASGAAGGSEAQDG